MPFDEQSLAEARSQGYTDDQIYQHLAGSDERFRVAKENGYSLDDIAAHLTQKGGEQDNDKQETRMGGDAQRAADQQVEDRTQEGVQSPEQRVQAYGQQRMREDGSGEPQTPEREGVLLTPEAKEGGEVVGEKANQDEGTRQGQENGQGIPVQSPSGFQAQISDMGGVRPPSRGYIEGIIEGIKKDPSKAAIAGGEELAGTAIDLAVGGTVAAGITALAEAGTFGAATPVVPAIAMAGMAAGTWASSKVRKGIEDLLGIGKAIKSAKEENPELSEAASVLGMLPQVAKSVPRLIEMGSKKAAEQIALGAAGGAAFEAGVRYPVERGLEMVTGAEQETQAPTQESIVKSAAFGGILAGHAIKNEAGKKAISDAGLPETSEVAGAVKTDEAIEQTSSILEGAQAQKTQKQAVSEVESEIAKQIGETSEEAKDKIKGTGGVSAKQGISPDGKTEDQAKGGTAPGVGEGEEVGPQGTRLGAAAYRVPYGEYKGEVFEGKSHLDAMGEAKKAGAITQEDINARKEAKSRNTDEFGYTTNAEGEFVTREQAHDISRSSGQLKKEPFFKTKDGAKLHSDETELDRFDEKGKEVVPTWEYAKDPKQAISKTIEIGEKEGKPPETTLEKQGLTRTDAEQAGALPEEKVKPTNLISSVKNMVRDISDSIKPEQIKALTKAGVADESHQHASAKIYVPVKAEELLSKVFPDSYKNKEEMSKTMDILNKDDIVGGYEQLRSELNENLKDLAAAKQAGNKTGRIENQIEAIRERLDDIAGAHDINAYKKEINAAAGTKIEDNIKRWTQYVVSEMDGLYNELKNVDPNTDREGRGWKFGSRVNLLSKSEEEKMASYGDLDKPMPTSSVSNYRNPNVKRDKFMQKATFLGDYSTDPMAILTNSLGSRWNEVTKIRLYKALESKGVGKIASPGDSEIKSIGGKDAVRLPIKFPETDPATGITRVVEKSLYVQKQLASELKQVLDVNERPEQNAISKAITKTQIVGFADATAHLKNQHNIVRNALGRDSVWGDLFAKVPIIGQAKSVAEITKVGKEVAANTPKIREEKAYLASIGALRAPSKEEGLLRFIGTHQLLHDVDTATRIILNRRYDTLIKRYGAIDTVESRRSFINQIGNYNRRVMGRWEALARDTGFSPFIVAGRAMNSYARKMIFADPGFRTDNMKGAIAARAANISGLAFATMVPALTNMFTTGSMWGREGTPIGAIDFGSNFDTDDGKRRTFDIFAITGIRRGLRQLGLNAAIEGVRNGKDIRDIGRDMGNDFVTTKMHPWIGPGVGLLQETTTGKRFDLRTGYAQRYEARKVEGLGQYAENFRIALKQLNPLLYGVVGPSVEGAMEKIGGIPRPAEEAAQSVKMAPVSKAFGLPKGAQRVEQAIVKPVAGAVGYSEMNTPAIQLANSFGEAVQFTPEQDIRFAYRKQIMDSMKKGDFNTAKELYSQGYKDGILTQADNASIARGEKYPERISQKVQMLKTADEAVRVFRSATAVEQNAILETVARKVMDSTTLRPEQKLKLWNTMKGAAKPNTMLSGIVGVAKE